MKTRITQLTITPEGASLFDDRSTYIDIDDEGDGEFVKVAQYSRTAGIAIDAKEWPAIRAAIDRLFEECKR